jgi:uncharacterized protein Yka (UPF0111/DUF47 family)
MSTQKQELQEELEEGLFLSFEQYDILSEIVSKLDYADDAIRDLAMDKDNDPKVLGFKLGTLYKDINAAFVKLNAVVENIQEVQLDLKPAEGNLEDTAETSFGA